MAAKKMTKDMAIAALAENEYDRLDHGNLLDVLIEGCVGWSNMSGEEIIKAYADYLGEEIEIVEEDEQ